MKILENKRNNQVLKLIMVLKIIYLSLSIFALLSYFRQNRDVQKSEILTLILLSISLLMILIYLYKTLSKKNFSMDFKLNIRNNIETLIFIGLFLGTIYQTGLAYSGYKLLGIFIVIIKAIEFGRRQSILISVILSLMIIFIDFITMGSHKQILSMYFEIDTVIIVSLFVLAFILGLYVDIEKEQVKNLKKLASIDELTGLFNHRYFQQKLDQYMEESQYNHTKLSLLFIDIDFFKNYNDINGHQIGDKLLREISSIMKSCIRRTDVLARYGGEEFVAILPNTAEYDAVKIAERIRIAIEKHQFYGQENQPNKNITISIGVSTYPDKAESKEQLLNTADNALYRAKSFNKNRVESYG